MPKSIGVFKAMQFIPLVLRILQAVEESDNDPGFSEDEAERLKGIIVSAIAATDSVVDIPQELILKISLNAVDLARNLSELFALSEDEILAAADSIRASRASAVDGE